MLKIFYVEKHSFAKRSFCSICNLEESPSYRKKRYEPIENFCHFTLNYVSINYPSTKLFFDYSSVRSTIMFFLHFCMDYISYLTILHWRAIIAKTRHFSGFSYLFRLDLILIWRRCRDSNSRSLTAQTLSKRPPSTTRPHLRAHGR